MRITEKGRAEEPRGAWPLRAVWRGLAQVCRGAGALRARAEVCPAGGAIPATPELGLRAAKTRVYGSRGDQTAKEGLDLNKLNLLPSRPFSRGAARTEGAVP